MPAPEIGPRKILALSLPLNVAKNIYFGKLKNRARLLFGCWEASIWRIPLFILLPR